MNFHRACLVALGVVGGSASLGDSVGGKLSKMNEDDVIAKLYKILMS